MPHAPLTRPLRTHRLRWLHARRHADELIVELRAAIADADHLDLDLLGDAPVRTAAGTQARLDALAHDLVDRMRAARWDETAAPRAVTSVLAASVPAAEALLLRAARTGRR